MQRRTLAKAAALVAMTALVGHSHAQSNYPEKPIRIVVPFLPGGSPDVVARLIGDRMSRALGQPVVVENKPGANGIIGADTVAKAAPDGYTLLIADTGQMSINPSLYRKLPYDPQKAFAPIGHVMATPLYFVVRADLPIRNMKELVAYSQTGNGLPYGSSGNGSALHLGIEMFQRISGAKLQHIPYKGAAQMPAAMLAGDIGLFFTGWTIAGPHVKSGRMRAIAVGSAQRAAFQPDIPTVAESGFPGFEVDSRNGLLAPYGTPPEIIARLNKVLGEIVQQADVRERLAGMGIDVIHNTPEQYAAAIRSDQEKYAKVISSLGISLD